MKPFSAYEPAAVLSRNRFWSLVSMDLVEMAPAPRAAQGRSPYPRARTSPSVTFMRIRYSHAPCAAPGPTRSKTIAAAMLGLHLPKLSHRAQGVVGTGVGGGVDGAGVGAALDSCSSSSSSSPFLPRKTSTKACRRFSPYRCHCIRYDSPVTYVSNCPRLSKTVVTFAKPGTCM